MRRRRNSIDEEIRRAWRDLVADGGGDANAVEEYLNLLRRREDPETAARSERERQHRALDDARSLIRQEYFDSVASHAQTLIDDIRSGRLTSRERLHDRVTEESGNSRWAVYTAASQQAVWVSENANYALEEGLISLDGQTDMPWSALAGWAFYRDLLDELDRQGIDLNDDSEWPTPENLADDDEEDADLRKAARSVAALLVKKSRAK